MFGNALGNAIVGGIQNRAKPAAQSQTNGDFNPSAQQLDDWQRLMLDEGRLPGVTLGGPRGLLPRGVTAQSHANKDPWFDPNYQPMIEELPGGGAASTPVLTPIPGELELGVRRAAGGLYGVGKTVVDGIVGTAVLGRDFGGAALHQLGLMSDSQYSDNIGRMVDAGLKFVSGDDPLGAIVDHYDQRFTLANQLDAQGRYEEAAAIRAGSTFEVLSGVVGAGGALNGARKGMVSLASRIDELGPGPGVYRAQIGAVGDVERIALSGETSATVAGASTPLRLGNRKLPESDMPWVSYQKHVTGRSFEELWQLNGQKIALDARRVGYTVEAKWTGRNDAAWQSSPYNPSHRYYNEAKIVDQAFRQLELNAATGGNGVRFAVSNEAAQLHFQTLFQQQFPVQMNNGTLNVWYVPGNGMR